LHRAFDLHRAPPSRTILAIDSRDWRNPRAVAGFQRHQRQLELARAARKKRAPMRTETPKDSLVFRGWRWICPQCQRSVNVLFLPVAPVNLITSAVAVGMDFPGVPRVNPKSEVRNPKQIQISNSENPKSGFDASDLEPSDLFRISNFGFRASHEVGFACERCHRVRRFSRCDPNSWNEIICYLTGGLLYGNEVPRPSWFEKSQRVDRMDSENRKSQIAIRKLPYSPRPNRAPSQRRPQVEKMLLDGMDFQTIADKLNLTKGTILWTAQQVYKQHNVRTLNEFLAKHGKSPIVKKREQVRQRILQGETVEQIARELNISAMCVYNHVYMLRKSGAIPKSTYFDRGARKTLQSCVRREEIPVLRTGANYT
jgi:DNA-binding NarL/FixJ family response regulator